MPDPAALMTTADMRDCILAAIRRAVRNMGASTAGFELALHETNVRRRLDRGQASDWSMADFAALMAHERDAVGTRALLDAVIEADGRTLARVDPADAERACSALMRGFADELAVMLRRLDNGIDPREAAMTADELEPLITTAQAALRTLRARAATANR
jgi:hypothetical protein